MAEEEKEEKDSLVDYTALCQHTYIERRVVSHIVHCTPARGQNDGVLLTTPIFSRPRAGLVISSLFAHSFRGKEEFAAARESRLWWSSPK